MSRAPGRPVPLTAHRLCSGADVGRQRRTRGGSRCVASGGWSAPSSPLGGAFRRGGGQAPEKPRAQGGRCAGLPDHPASTAPVAAPIRRKSDDAIFTRGPGSRTASKQWPSGRSSRDLDGGTIGADAALRRGDLVQRGVPCRAAPGAVSSPSWPVLAIAAPAFPEHREATGGVEKQAWGVRVGASLHRFDASPTRSSVPLVAVDGWFSPSYPPGRAGTGWPVRPAWSPRRSCRSRRSCRAAPEPCRRPSCPWHRTRRPAWSPR